MNKQKTQELLYNTLGPLLSCLLILYIIDLVLFFGFGWTNFSFFDIFERIKHEDL